MEFIIFIGMKILKYLMFLGGLSFIYSLNAQDLEKDQIIKEKLKRYQLDVYEAVYDSLGIGEGAYTGSFSDHFIIEYDKKHRPLNKIFFTSGSKEYFRYTYSYNKKGLLEKQIAVHPGKDPSMWWVWEYDSQNRISSYKFYFSENPKSKERFDYKYNSEGIIIEEKEYLWESLSTILTHTVNHQGKITSTKKVFVQQNNAENISYFEYDDAGNLIKENKFDSENKSCYKNISEYNSSGKLVKSISFGADSTALNIDTYSYDENGNIVEIYTEYTGEDGFKRHYEIIYVYDKKKNWIRKTWKMDGEPTQIVIRKLDYV